MVRNDLTISYLTIFYVKFNRITIESFGDRTFCDLQYRKCIFLTYQYRDRLLKVFIIFGN